MKWLDRLEEGLLALSLAVMVAINFGNVLSRYIFHASWSFSEEMMVILFVYNSFLGASLAYRRKAHMGFAALTDSLPFGLRKITIILSAVLSLSLMVLLIYCGWDMVRGQMQYGQKTPALGLPEAIAGSIIPIGSALIAFRIIQYYFNCFCDISKASVAIEKRVGE